MTAEHRDAARTVLPDYWAQQDALSWIRARHPTDPDLVVRMRIGRDNDGAPICTAILIEREDGRMTARDLRKVAVGDLMREVAQSVPWIAAARANNGKLRRRRPRHGDYHHSLIWALSRRTNRTAPTRPVEWMRAEWFAETGTDVSASTMRRWRKAALAWEERRAATFRV